MKEASLLSLARRVQLIARVTPVNADSEMARLCCAFERGEPCLPRWEYAGVSGAPDEAFTLATAGPARFDEPLRSLLVERIREIRLEVAIGAAAGTPALGRLASERYGWARVSEARTADALAARWAAEAARWTGTGNGLIRSDDDGDRRSLLCQMRAAIGAHRLPFAVQANAGIQALAATGERAVYVAEGRLLSERVGRRVVVHEVLGHVLPRVRASAAHPIFALGTARGTDEQEGLALLYEERARLLDATRRVELSLRHVAAAVMTEGADFPQTVAHLRARRPDLPLQRALQIAARAFRGGDGRSSGLGRERVYLPALLRVRRHLEVRPADEVTLASGQVAVGALPFLRELHLPGKQASPWPPPTTLTV